MEESEEELEEDSTGAMVVLAMEARSSASTSIGANWEVPWVLVVIAGGAASEQMVPALDATVSAMEARSSPSISMGASLEEPCITCGLGGERRWSQQ